MAEDTTQELEQAEETNQSQSDVEETNNPDMLQELMEIAKQDTSIPEEETETEEEVSEEEEEIAEEEDSQEEEQPVEAESPKEEFVIDDEIIKQYPTLKSYRGKDLKTILNAYDNLVRTYQKDHQELAELKKKPQQVSKSEEVIDEMPDPLDDPAGFKKWNERNLAKIKEELRNEMKSQIPNDNSSQRQEAERMQTYIISEIEKQLPGLSYKDALEYWHNENSDTLYDHLGEPIKENFEYYSRNPQKLIKEVIMLNKGRIPKSAPKEVVEAKKKAVEQVRKSVRASQKSLPDTSIKKSAPRNDELTSDDKFLMSIKDAVESNNPV